MMVSLHTSPGISTACHLSTMLSLVLSGSCDGPCHSNKHALALQLLLSGSGSILMQGTHAKETSALDWSRKVCHLHGSACIDVLEGGQGLRGQYWDGMQPAASHA